jgi:hypothetical protein
VTWTVLAGNVVLAEVVALELVTVVIPAVPAVVLMLPVILELVVPALPVNVVV